MKQELRLLKPARLSVTLLSILVLLCGLGSQSKLTVNGLTCNDDAYLEGEQPLGDEDDCRQGEDSCYYIICQLPDGSSQLFLFTFLKEDILGLNKAKCNNPVPSCFFTNLFATGQ